MSQRTCAHQPCDCVVEGDSIYCSSNCEEAVRMRSGDAVECGCDHNGCGGKANVKK